MTTIAPRLVLARRVCRPPTRQLPRFGYLVHYRKATALAVGVLAAVTCWPNLLAGPAWLHGSLGQSPQRQNRRSVGATLLSGLATLTLRSSRVLAEQNPVLTLPTISSSTTLVQSPTKDFVIRTPVAWTTSLDNYAGRLVFSTERPDAKGNFTFLQVSKLNLPALFRSANAVLPDTYKASSRWEELAVGGTTPEILAKWMLDAQQKSVQAQSGRSFVRNVDVMDVQLKTGGGAGSGSELSWHALVTIPPGGLAGGGAMEGSGGRLVSLTDQPANTGTDLPPRMVSGKALLRGGVVVFAVTDGPKTRYEADYGGLSGAQYFDGIVQSLELTASQKV